MAPNGPCESAVAMARNLETKHNSFQPLQASSSRLSRQNFSPVQPDGHGSAISPRAGIGRVYTAAADTIGPSVCVLWVAPVPCMTHAWSFQTQEESKATLMGRYVRLGYMNPFCIRWSRCKSNFNTFIYQLGGGGLHVTMQTRYFLSVDVLMPILKLLLTMFHWEGSFSFWGVESSLLNWWSIWRRGNVCQMPLFSAGESFTSGESVASTLWLVWAWLVDGNVVLATSTKMLLS